MKSVLFQPWIGEKYFNEGYKGKRLLILGESHYCADCGPDDFCKEYDPHSDCILPDFTRNLIMNQITRKKKIAFVTKLENALSIAMNMQMDTKSVWCHVSFYNYIQQIAAATPGIAPTNEMFQKAQLPFSEVLDYLKPDFMLVLSERLWNNMPGIASTDWPLYKELPIDAEIKKEKIYWHTIDKKLPLKMYSFHPRYSRFTEIIPYLKEALQIITTEL